MDFEQSGNGYVKWAPAGLARRSATPLLVAVVSINYFFERGHKLMWVFLSNSFLSIVKHRDREDALLVRARLPGDITEVFPEAEVFEDAAADYKYRAIVSRDRVGQVLKDEVESIQYTNFKNSVADRNRHDAYLDVWSVMVGLQEKHG